jgi:hypothetical protein
MPKSVKSTSRLWCPAHRAYNRPILVTLWGRRFAVPFTQHSIVQCERRDPHELFSHQHRATAHDGTIFTWFAHEPQGVHP